MKKSTLSEILIKERRHILEGFLIIHNTKLVFFDHIHNIVTLHTTISYKYVIFRYSTHGKPNMSALWSIQDLVGQSFRCPNL